MQDLIHVAAMVLFFPVAFLFMGFLDRLLGPDQGKGPRLTRPARATQKVELLPQNDQVRAA